MSNHDHLDPLPDATPGVVIGAVLGGTMIGVFTLLLDVWVTNALLGFENPYITFALAFMSIFGITGAMKDDSLGVVLPFLGGTVIGVIGMNAVRVHGFGEASMLSGVGL